MSLDQTLIDEIVNRVLTLLSKQQNSVSTKNILFLFSGAKAGTEAGLEAIRRLSGSSHTFSVMRTESARNIIPEARLREAGAQDLVIADSRTDIAGLVKRTDLLLIPTLTTRLVGHLALGLMESPAATLILRTLLAGKSVIGIKDASDPAGYVARQVYGGKREASPALYSILEKNLTTLECFGMELVSETDFLTALDRRLQGQGIASGSKVVLPGSVGTASLQLSGIVTERDLMGLVEGSVVFCAPGTRLTAQAQDSARRLRLQLEMA